MKKLPPYSACVMSLLALLCPGLVPAQQKTEPVPAPAQREGCVWKLVKGGRTVYLAGSVHLLREEDYPISTAYDAAYADSGEVIFEVDMAEMTNPANLMKMQQLGMYGADDSLDKHLKPETMKSLREYLNGHESGALLQLALPRMKPGMVFLSISSLEALRLKARPDLGLETVYFQKAKEDGKPSRGLETIEFQMRLFDSFTDAEIDRLIAKTLADTKDAGKVLADMIARWHAGDAVKLDELLNEEMDKSEDDGRLKKLLLIDRNKNWIPEIETALDGGKNTLFIVGAGHLVGKDGVVDLLEKKGYRLEKVKAPAAAAKAAPNKKKKAA